MLHKKISNILKHYNTQFLKNTFFYKQKVTEVHLQSYHITALTHEKLLQFLSTLLVFQNHAYS